MKENPEGVELVFFKNGKPVSAVKSKPSSPWEKFVCFATGDLTREELDEIGRSSRKKYADFKMAQEVPPTIRQAKPLKKKYVFSVARVLL